MSKSSNRQETAYFMGQLSKKQGQSMKIYSVPKLFRESFASGFNRGWTKKTKIAIKNFIKKIKLRSTTQKNRDKRFRKKLRKLYA